MDCLAATSIGLKQVHELVSGLFVSSASEGKFASSLDILLTPKRISGTQVTELNPAAKDLLMCKFKNTLSGKTEWCSYRHHRLMQRECEAYALSGLSAFPLPVWPFFGDKNGGLNVFKHFAEYLPAYHPSFKLEKVSGSSIHVTDGGSSLSISYEKEQCFVCSAFVSKNSCLRVSLYGKGFGACVIDADSNFLISPINFIEKLDTLQYEGSVCCIRLERSRINYAFTSTFFLENGEDSRRTAENIFDFVIDATASNFDSFDVEKSLASIISIASL